MFYDVIIFYLLIKITVTTLSTILKIYIIFKKKTFLLFYLFTISVFNCS